MKSNDFPGPMTWQTAYIDGGWRANLDITVIMMDTNDSDCALLNAKGKTVAVGSRDQVVRYLRHHVQDGMFAVEGPGINMAFYRIGGCVYPCGGTQDGLRFPPRSREECVRVFGPAG